MSDHASLAEAAWAGGRYRIERLLGRGGMGTVHAAVEVASGKRIAIKRLSATADGKLRALFEREYRTLHGLRHARIIDVYDYGTDEHGPFYTMELLEGHDLSSEARLGWRRVAEILREIASALGVLHARRLVHRDLSPRNVWVLGNGHIKLLDFGALMSFGTPTEIVGTPAFVPPEALHARPLDQRADLYALGALGYWLATGVHAYPASTFGGLQQAWERAPVPPSRLVGPSDDLRREPIPAAFDALLSALLRLQATDRPLNTEVLIERLNALIGAQPESNATAAQGYLASKVFVGRARERAQVEKLLHKAQNGEGRAVLIEASSGFGRTRLLEEIAVLGRLRGALTLSVDSFAAARRYGVVNALALRLLDLLPREAAHAAQPHAGLLGRLSPELRARLSVEALATTRDPAELRLRVQGALEQWLFSLCKLQPIVLLLDDFSAFDDESATFFAGLAHELASRRILLIASAGSEQMSELSPPTQHLAGVAVRIRLPALSAAETHDLLVSVFGSAPYLSRFSERLHRFTEGNPAHCMEAAEYLVRTSVVEYKDGMWVLPNELLPEQLPRNRGETYLLRLDRVRAETRELARVLSIQVGAFPVARVSVLSGEAKDAPVRLSELVQAGVLIESDSGCHFAHPALRETLLSELSPAQRERAHHRLGRALLAVARDPRDCIAAGVHLFRGGKQMEGERLIRDGVEYCLDVDLSNLGPLVPVLEEALSLYRAAGRDAYSLANPLGLLAAAGYFVDRRLGARYGELAIATLERLLRIDLARRWRRFLGKKLALFVALGVAFVALTVHRRRAPTFVAAVRWLIGVASALAGMAACCIDPELATRYAQTIEPLTALGKDHAATFIHRFSLALAKQVRDRPAESEVELRALIARLESEQPIRDLNENLRINYLAGCLLALGITECWRDGGAGLAIADRLETFGPLYEMSADHLRASYYESQGALGQAAVYRERVEKHAVRLGSAWQMETWAPADATKIALRTHEPLVAKRAAQELDRLAIEVPSLGLEARHALGTYHMLRGDHEAAIPLLDTGEEPASVVGWARTRGSLARAYNCLGEHAKAREICRHAMGLLSAEDLTFSVMNLSVQVELALAEAGLDNLGAAREVLDRLLCIHGAAQGPLTLGALHEARALVALEEGELGVAVRHLREMERWYRPTEIASLAERCERLIASLRRTQHPELGEQGGALPTDANIVTRIERVLSSIGDVSRQERTHKGLMLALELSGAKEGFIMLSADGGALAGYTGDIASDAELTTWARDWLRSVGENQETAVADGSDLVGDAGTKVCGRICYSIAPLWTVEEQGLVVLSAALVLGFEETELRMPSNEVLHLIARHVLQPSA